jgi:hypothetical protein
MNPDQCVLMRLAVALILLASSVTGFSPAQGMEAGHMSLVPKAVCGPSDRTESVQGEVTLAERFAPDPKKAYACNLELVGEFVGEGSPFSSVAYDNCAYYTTTVSPGMKNPGVVTLDVSNPRNPHPTAYLDSPGMLYANESLETHKGRQLLVGSAAWVNTQFDVYDLSKGCTHPTLLSSTSFPRTLVHSGHFAPDGMTFYGAMWSGTAMPAGSSYAYPKRTRNDPPPSALFVIDMSDPAKPHLLDTWIPLGENWRTHSASVNKDGTRVYLTIYRELDDYLKSPHANGLLVLDSSDFQARRPSPQFRIVSTLFWDDSHYAQYALPVTVKERSYVVFTDVAGAIGAGAWGGSGATERVPSCDSGKPNYGFARLVDITDERKPVTVAKLLLEVDDPTNCNKVKYDPALGFKYGSEGCGVDNDRDAHLLACGYLEGGLRVFDIRDVTHPREIAYYKPPAVGSATRAGNPNALVTIASYAKGQEGAGRTADQVVRPTFHGAGDNLEIWFNSGDNGFQIVRFTDEFKAREKDLFAT